MSKEEHPMQVWTKAVLAATMMIAIDEAAATTKPFAFVAFGDSGYIPSYERPDPEEPFPTTLGEYLAAEARDWEEHHGSLEGFRPTPWTFESALGAFLPASGLYPVARAMDERCRMAGCDFAVMLGDNIYPDGAVLGSDGISDERRFEDMLERPFRDLGAGVEDFRIYTLLGNHDWHHSREGAEAQRDWLRAHPRFVMPDFHYRVVPAGFEGEVELFVIDTEMLLAGTEVRKDELDAEGRPLDTGKLEEWPDFVRARTESERRMVEWLGEALADSKARWKLVLGHHALWSGGGSKFEKARALRRLLMPALCRHADAYFSGDDHMVEVYSHRCEPGAGVPEQPLPTLVSGAAGKHRSLHPAFMKAQLADHPELESHYSRGSTWGFMHVRVDGESMEIRVYSTANGPEGRPVEEWVQRFPRRSGLSAR
jgi:tartrate-resistant acid phosphatase type 5